MAMEFIPTLSWGAPYSPGLARQIQQTRGGKTRNRSHAELSLQSNLSRLQHIVMHPGTGYFNTNPQRKLPPGLTPLSSSSC